jgi:hypothetical protein
MVNEQNFDAKIYQHAITWQQEADEAETVFLLYACCGI